MKHKFLWVIFIIIAGLAIFIFGSGNPYKINLITAAILAATLVSILWYTVETHKLRTNYEKGAEIESFPWLTGSDLKVNKNETIENFIWSDTIYLPIKNVGKTPAFDISLRRIIAFDMILRRTIAFDMILRRIPAFDMIPRRTPAFDMILR